MTVDDLRARFRHGLTGQWSTIDGTFEIIRSEVWRFAANGTGTLDSETFEWRAAGDWKIAVRSEDGWMEIAYDFRLVTHDAGTEIGLHEVGCDGFWLSLSPLRFLGD